MFQKVLIANRGEIVVRVIRACQELGMKTVVMPSEADAKSHWALMADERIILPGVTAAETYLNQALILKLAQDAGIQAIHPGYGFLSENADFVDECENAGIAFIGPSSPAMRLIGSKASARCVAEKAGVPVVPGVDGASKNDAELVEAAHAIGYPILIKASAGGGGKGMRVVWSANDLLDALQAAKSEAQSAFGDSHLLLEKFFTEIRHVEVQILGDHQGNLIHLFERECSIQRRHQKIVEESPSPTISPKLRKNLTEAALKLAQTVDYWNAGTVEFIVDENENFYFLEMNTRLQVEHPVTELVTGIDLVHWQLRIAAGETLTIAQNEVQQRGHALECRIYAEDPANHFLPSIGTVEYVDFLQGPGVRVDAGISHNSTVTPYYDPMLGKIITWGASRTEAIKKMNNALQKSIILGITTNITYLSDIINSEPFLAGETTTNFITDHFPEWQPQNSVTPEILATLAAMELSNNGGKRGGWEGENAGSPEPWELLSNWRNLT